MIGNEVALKPTIYTGMIESKDGRFFALPHGKGEVKFQLPENPEIKSSYKGGFKNGKFHGMIAATTPTGSRRV